MITPEQWDALSSLHNATAQRRPYGWIRWAAVCERCGWTLDQVGGREGAQRAAEEHNTELNPDEPPAEPECNCLVLLGADLVETSPLDCPLHKEPESE